MNRRKLVIARDFFIVLVGIVFLFSMADVDLTRMNERDYVAVVGGITALIFWSFLYFIFRKKEEVGAKENV